MKKTSEPKLREGQDRADQSKTEQSSSNAPKSNKKSAKTTYVDKAKNTGQDKPVEIKNKKGWTSVKNEDFFKPAEKESPKRGDSNPYEDLESGGEYYDGSSSEFRPD